MIIIFGSIIDIIGGPCGGFFLENVNGVPGLL